MFSHSPALGAVVLACLLSACTQSSDLLDEVKTSSVSASPKERDCLARAMFFESRRNSRDGLVAVGTVVMNRVESGQYPGSICGVVGQKNQFAPGVLTRNMNSKALPDVMAAADAVMRGERHPAVHSAHHFHQAGLKFPYKNMHYVLEAGGNAFYEKRSRRSPARDVARDARHAIRTALDEESRKTDASSPGTALSYSNVPASADAIGEMIRQRKQPD